MAKTWTREDVEQLLTSNDEVGKAIITLMGLRQHGEEIGAAGFDARDDQFMSSLGNFYQRRGYLSPRQLYYARRNLRKYILQLADFHTAREALDEDAPAPAINPETLRPTRERLLE